MQPIPIHTLRLGLGAHGDVFTGDACIVEAANRIAAGEVLADAVLPCRPAPVPFAANHPSISRVVRAFAIGLNDAWDDDSRQRLLPCAPRLLCTATGAADDEVRAWMAVDWLVREICPAFLRLAGLEAHAAALEGCAPLDGMAAAVAAQPALFGARQHAWTRARHAFQSGATGVSGAVRVAARTAGAEAAGAAAGLGVAAGRGPAPAATLAVWEAAGAAWETEWPALRDTVQALQSRALALLHAMVEIGR
ncbi:MAG TPA: hypothetical protein VLK84_21015 [Longimicrobium sp.]|nr:hypothetical protein [Longimicrobium sp.]